jgi:hypothetical protein
MIANTILAIRSHSEAERVICARLQRWPGSGCGPDQGGELCLPAGRGIVVSGALRGKGIAPVWCKSPPARAQRRVRVVARRLRRAPDVITERHFQPPPRFTARLDGPPSCAGARHIARCPGGFSVALLLGRGTAMPWCPGSRPNSHSASARSVPWRRRPRRRPAPLRASGQKLRLQAARRLSRPVPR